MELVTNEQLVDETTTHAPTVGVKQDKAPSVKSEERLVTPGW